MPKKVKKNKPKPKLPNEGGQVGDRKTGYINIKLGPKKKKTPKAPGDPFAGFGIGGKDRAQLNWILKNKGEAGLKEFIARSKAPWADALKQKYGVGGVGGDLPPGKEGGKPKVGQPMPAGGGEEVDTMEKGGGGAVGGPQDPNDVAVQGGAGATDKQGGSVAGGTARTPNAGVPVPGSVNPLQDPYGTGQITPGGVQPIENWQTPGPGTPGSLGGYQVGAGQADNTGGYGQNPGMGQGGTPGVWNGNPGGSTGFPGGAMGEAQGGQGGLGGFGGNPGMGGSGGIFAGGGNPGGATSINPKTGLPHNPPVGGGIPGQMPPGQQNPAAGDYPVHRLLAMMSPEQRAQFEQERANIKPGSGGMHNQVRSWAQRMGVPWEKLSAPRAPQPIGGGGIRPMPMPPGGDPYQGAITGKPGIGGIGGGFNRPPITGQQGPNILPNPGGLPPRPVNSGPGQPQQPQPNPDVEKLMSAF